VEVQMETLVNTLTLTVGDTVPQRPVASPGTVTALAVLVAVVVALGLWVPRETVQRIASDVARASDTARATVAAGTIQPRSETALEREQRAASEYLARRYRVSDEAVAGFVASAYRSGKRFSVDPLLILSVAAVESRFNPVAESVFGAQGLMQVIPRFHFDKLGSGGAVSLLDPDTNIQVGAQILQEYLRRTGDLEGALQLYSGAPDDPVAAYATKVLGERTRLEQAVQRQRRPV
jgi:soluble lytic murein transglycosylase-like protein